MEVVASSSSRHIGSSRGSVANSFWNGGQLTSFRAHSPSLKTGPANQQQYFERDYSCGPSSRLLEPVCQEPVPPTDVINVIALRVRCTLSNQARKGVTLSLGPQERGGEIPLPDLFYSLPPSQYLVEHLPWVSLGGFSH